MKHFKNPFIQIAGICSILAPLTLLAGDLLLVTTNMRFEGTIFTWIGCVLFVPAVFGLSNLLFESGSRLAIVGGIFAFFGAIAGASMQVLFRVYAVLDEAGAAQTIELLRGTQKLVISTQAIGITLPVGLILLAVGLYLSRLLNPFIPLLLVIGAVLFPVGRIGGFSAAVFGSDIFLTAAFGFIGGWILTSSEIRRQTGNFSTDMQSAAADDS